MGLNCSQCYSTSPSDHCLTEIEVDADIAGIGVLVAFFLASLVTCMAILFGYLSDSLPRSILSSADEAAIRFYRTTFIARRLVPKIGLFWLSLKSLLYCCARRDPPQSQRVLTRERRVEATTRFLLGFSDQQLVTGLAMLIAALANRSQLTLYELQIVFCLAWFSATTHIATVQILREYFYDHAVVRNWRVLGIFAFTVLICFFQVILLLAGDPQTTDGVNYGRPIQCIINGDSRRESFGGFEILSEGYLLVFLLVLYVPPTLALFEDPRKVPQPSSGSRLVLKLSNLHSKHLPRQLPKNARVVLCQNAEIQHHIVTESHVSAESPRLSHGLSQYQNSFLSSLPTIMFSITFGIAQTVVLTWIDSPKTTDDVRRMGFGQVVAIGLLAIPFLTATEIYNEATKAIVNQDEPQSEDDVNDMETSQHLAPELALSEYEERQRSLGIDEPTSEANALHQKISRELSKQVGIGGLSPFRRHLIVHSSLHYTLEKQRGLCPATKLYRIRQDISKLQTRLVFTSDLFVETFGAITLNTSGLLNVFGSSLLMMSAAFRILQPLSDLRTRYDVMKSQSDFLKSKRDWLEEHHGHLMEDDDRLFFLTHEQPGKDKAISDGPNEMDFESPKRQDTEADIAIVRRRSTHRTE